MIRFMVILLTSVSLSCHTVYLPKEKAVYAREIEALKKDREDLHRALRRCYEAGNDLRKDCH